MRTLVAALCCAAWAVSAAGDAMAPSAMAQAPGPASALAKADLLFTLSANTANFTSPTRLTLGGLSYTAQFSGNGKTGIYPVGLFFNSSEGAPFTSANGDWLGGPQAVLYGSIRGGNTTAIILNLSAPMYDAETNTATFDVATTMSPKYKGGAVANAAADALKNVGPMLMNNVSSTTELRATALFLDTNRLALGRAGDTKWFGWGGGWGGGGWGGGWGNNWGNNWGGGYYQPTYYYQPYYGGGWNGGGGCGCGCGYCG